MLGAKLGPNGEENGSGRRAGIGVECCVVDQNLEKRDRGEKRDVVAYAFRYLDQWKAAQISSDSSWPILMAADVSEQWTPPNGISVKINVDAAMFNDGRSFGLGMVARNSDGLLIAGRMKYTAVQVEVAVAEAIGIREVLSWLKENRWPQVYIETDSLCVVQAIHSSTDMISLFGSVIQDCKTLLASLNNVVVSFVKRSANVVAHKFARAARLYPDCTCSLETIPTELLSCLVADYFTQLFTVAADDHWALSHILSTIPTTITYDHNAYLLQDFSKDDVLMALKSMGGDKSLGLDGMFAMFYQHNWDIVGSLVIEVVLEVLNNGANPAAFNKTLITLIPKIKKPKTMKDFRPISLCNVVYKLVSKCIVVLLKNVLHHVISETQSAFLPHRLITDNVLVAFEMIHSLKHRRRGSKGYAALKLDMSKAFDRVEWSCVAIKRALDIYHRASGQLLNEDKSVMSFSPNTLEHVQHSLSNILDLLQRDFSCVDVPNILKIPLSFSTTTDLWIWNNTTSGEYTVQSGYHFACSLENQHRATSSTSEQSWWKAFWGLNLPSKVRIFAWRVIQHSIPVAAALFQRKIITSVACSLCSNAWESIGHAMFSCKHAKTVWRHSNFSYDYQAASRMKEGDFLMYLLNIHTKSDMEKIICTMWSIWSDRNNIIHNKSPQQPAAIYAKSLAYLNNFQQVTSTDSAPPINSHVAAHQQWRSPPCGQLKMNVDVAVDTSHNRTGFGAIVRDSNGLGVAAISKSIAGNIKSHEMEAKALCHGLQWARNLQLQISFVETDSVMVVNSITGLASKNLDFKD
uniref:Reverse transcriptase n=1 Tax=Cannabis sativa TaxID=3483 RepID=A0A803QPV3_CANSA